MARERSRLETVVWPGFVDVMTALLLVLFLGFLVMAVKQYTLVSSDQRARDRALHALRQELMEKDASLSRRGQELTQLAAVLDEAEQQALLEFDSPPPDGQSLSQRVARLSGQLSEIAGALEASRQHNQELKAELLSLGNELNAALATKAQDLNRYKSEFFGSLRDIVSRNAGIKIINDRFLIQSEILFPSGSATISSSGQKQIQNIADILIKLSAEFPGGIDWLIRIDGHTDDLPIASSRFPSNLELSLARATAVANLMATAGIPRERLVPSGFSSYRPLTAGKTAEARRQNRRIELKITQY